MMVGHLGATALAAVGVGGFLVFLFHSITLGLSSGVQAVTARLLGEGAHERSAVALNAAIIVMLVLAPIYSFLLYWLVPYIVPLVNSDPAVIELAVPYAQARVLSVLFVGSNFAFRGYWAATELTRWYLITFIVMYAFNALLNYALIFGHFGFPELGVLGSGIASAIAMAFGSCIYTILAWRLARSKGFGRVRPTTNEIRQLLKFAIPYGVQQLLFGGAFTVFYWIVGHMGTEEVAASAVLVNLMLFAFLPGIAYGIAAATFVGQSVAKNDWREAQHWASDVIKLSLLSLLLLSVPFTLFPQQVLSLFIQEPHVIELAVTPLRIAGVFLFAEAIGMVLMQTLHGVGEAKNVMRISVSVQWLYFLPLSYLVGPVLGGGMVAVWSIHASYRVLQAILFWLRWRRKVNEFIA